MLSTIIVAGINFEHSIVLSDRVFWRENAYCIIPALLNMMSTPPQSSRCSTMALTSDSLETSHVTVSIRGGLWRIVWIFERAFSRAGSDISAMRTAAPSRAKRMVVSRPIPLHKSYVNGKAITEEGSGNNVRAVRGVLSESGGASDLQIQLWSMIYLRETGLNERLQMRPHHLLYGNSLDLPCRSGDNSFLASEAATPYSASHDDCYSISNLSFGLPGSEQSQGVLVLSNLISSHSRGALKKFRMILLTRDYASASERCCRALQAL